jgi:SAM-dependent methyltransferase
MSERSPSFADTSLPGRYERLLGAALFEPWATVLLAAVGIEPGARVIDIAAGTGVVSRAAAAQAGPDGYVLSTDLSAAMIAYTAGYPAAPGAAPIETGVASATGLGRADGEFDVALCQHGLQFFPDRAGAVREMRRVLRPGGIVGIAVWTPGHEVVPYGPLHSALRELGVPEPHPGAFAQDAFTVTADQVGAVLTDAGFEHVDSREVELMTHWPSAAALTATVDGTPFAALLDALDANEQAQARALVTERFARWARSDGSVTMPTYSVIARAVRH